MSNEGRAHERGSGPVALLAVLGASLLLALLTATLAYAPRADAAVDRRGVSEARTAGGFPLWYQDARGLRLELCLDGPPLCLAGRRSLRPPGGEAFWWNAEAEMERIGVGKSGRARLVLAVEAAFANRKPKSRIAFGRIRVRADNLKRRTVYKVTHPYGVLRARTDDRGELRVSRDIGAGKVRRYRPALRSRVFLGFLKWNRNAPRGHLGNPNIPHKVVGSPTGNNFFLLKGPTVGGKRDNDRKTKLFSVQGKRA